MDAGGRVIFEVGRVRLAAVEPADWVETVAVPDAYEVHWRRSDLPVPTDAGLARGPWLVLRDEGGLGAAILRELDLRGRPRVEVVAASAFERRTATSYAVRPARAEDLSEVCRAVAAECGAPAAVFHAWGADTPPQEEGSIDALREQLRRSVGGALAVVQALVRTGLAPTSRVFLATVGAVDAQAADVASQHASIIGLARTVACEHPELRCVCIDVDPALDAERQGSAVLDEADRGAADRHVALRQGARYVPRLVRSGNDLLPSRTESAALVVRAPGVLDALRVEQRPRRAPGPGEVEIAVVAAGVNFRDVLRTLDMYPDAAGPLGEECAGRIVATGQGVERLRVGDDVFAFAPAAMAGFVTCPADYAARKPANLTFEQAAALPVTCLTAEQALMSCARLRAGQRVLIHAAAGGVGLAAVQVAQRIGAEIFATAGSEQKRAYLRSLGIRHVTSSRSLDFSAAILHATDGAGVDVVLNSLTGEYIPASLAALRPGGCFVEIGKGGIWTVEEMARARPDVGYTILYLGDTREQSPAAVARMLEGLAAELNARRRAPLPVRVFPFDEATSAFRHMAQARHIGKIVLTMPRARLEQPLALSPDATYVVTGGTGGLGLPVVEWLAGRGARHVAVISRHAPAERAATRLGEIETRHGARISVLRADVADFGQLAAAFGQIAGTMPQVRGVIHAAGVLADGVLLDQDWARFEAVLAPKAYGAWNLHRLTLDVPLDFFALFSSFSGIAGSAGQANYAAANTFLDGLAQHRRSIGLPGVSIAWGPWQAGMIAALDERQRERWQRQGLQEMAPPRALAGLERVLERSGALAVLDADWPALLAASGRTGDAFYQELGARRPPATAPDGRAQLLATAAAAPAARRRPLMIDAIAAHARDVFGAAATKQFDPKRPLRELGLDSLMAVELRNALAASLGRTVPATLLFDYPTIESLADHVLGELLPAQPPAAARTLTLTPDQTPASAPAPDGDLSGAALEELEGLSLAEAEALLLSELNSSGNSR